MQHREQFTLPCSSLLCGYRDLGDLLLYSSMVWTQEAYTEVYMCPAAVQQLVKGFRVT